MFENYASDALTTNGEGVSYYVPDTTHDYVFSFNLHSTNDMKITGEGNINAAIPSLNGSWSNVEAKFTPRAYNGSERACPQVVSYWWSGGNTFKIKSFDVYQVVSAADVGDTKLDKSIEVDLSSATALYDKGKLNYNKENNSFEMVMVDEVKFDGVVIPLGISLANGESITVTVNGSQTGTGNLRMYLSNDGNSSVSNQVGGASFGQEYTFTATGTATQLLIKGGYGGELSALNINKVVVKK